MLKEKRPAVPAPYLYYVNYKDRDFLWKRNDLLRIIIFFKVLPLSKNGLQVVNRRS